MLEKLYVNNFRCLQNFDFDAKNINSIFLLGKNGSGKSTILDVFEIFNKIGQGEAYLPNLIKSDDFCFSNTKNTIEFEITLNIKNRYFKYKLDIDFLNTYEKTKIKHESLYVDNVEIMKRDEGQVVYNNKANFTLDWHYVGILLIVHRDGDEIDIFKKWLKNIVVLSPFPALISSVSSSENDSVDRECKEIVSCIRWLLASNPKTYNEFNKFLKDRMNDFQEIKFEEFADTKRNLVAIFEDNNQSLSLRLEQLSNGEKIFFIVACIIGICKVKENIICLWDEPSNYVGIHEIKHIITSVRKAFENSNSQLIITSHSSEVITSFPNSNIFVLKRSSHLSPSRVITDIKYDSPTIIDAYLNGELD